MRTHPSTARVRLAALILLSALAVSAPGAQVTDAARPSRAWINPNFATLILVDDIGAPKARAVVVRRAGELPNNIILVSRETNARELATAVSALITSRTNRGDQVDREIRTYIPAQQPRNNPTSSERLAARDLKRLPLAPEFEVAGVGRGPTIVIRMKDSGPAKAR